MAALYKATHPTASPYEVYQALITFASFPTTQCDGNGHGYFQGDKDGFSEPLLYVSKDYWTRMVSTYTSFYISIN